MFRWAPPRAEDIARWQDELDRIAPRTDRGPSWLKLVWLSGDDWTPWHHVQRWGIYQMSPIERAPFDIAQELRGPNPRWFGYWDRIAQRFIRSRNFLINREQWELYRETGCWGKLYWIVQGPPGGHRRRWDDRESRLSAVMGGDPQPPPPGELPYQPFSSAVIQRLREHDLILKYNRRGDFVSRDGNVLNEEERKAEADFREKLFDIQTEQVLDTLEFTHADIAKIRSAWRRVGRNTKEQPGAADVTDLEQLRDEFIHAEG